MTIEQAKEEINKCERNLSDACGAFEDSAEKFVRDVDYSANNQKLILTAAPLLISIFGVLIIQNSAAFGVILIIAGIMLAVKLHEKSSKAVSEVSRVLD